jgi:hypothetical protein
MEGEIDSSSGSSAARSLCAAGDELYNDPSWWFAGLRFSGELTLTWPKFGLSEGNFDGNKSNSY